MPIIIIKLTYLTKERENLPMPKIIKVYWNEVLYPINLVQQKLYNNENLFINFHFY